MDPANQRTIDGLRLAIQDEAKGYHFYMMAAGSTKDSQGKGVFTRLAMEELGHLQFLRTQYSALLQTGKPDEKARLGRRPRTAAPATIFSPEIYARLKEAHYEMSALSIGMRLEAAAVKLYTEMARQATDETVRKFFDELVAWETGHYDALSHQHEALQARYWAAGGFTPY
ncbi:MAG: ferritin family protein [Candidatus Riflebacteria bacterium]|nr:ferritin family protein [Candidatus Riflebacteria bacterium]